MTTFDRACKLAPTFLNDFFSMSVKFFEVGEEDHGQRLDNFLMRHFRNVPKTLIYRIIRKGEVRINKGRVKPNTRINQGDVIRIPPIKVPEAVASSGEVPESLKKAIEASILFEDKDMLVVNKPAGLAVHGGSGIHFGLIEVVRSIRPLAKRIELVHRIDRDTSGCLMIAKKASVLKELHRQIREDKVEKTYRAITGCHWPEKKKKVDLPLEKNTLQSGERIVRVSPQGKPSISFFEVVERFNSVDLVSVRLKTGRTHQIRVHAQANHCGLVGDDKYGDKDINKAFRSLGMKRLALHAYSLKFLHPGQDYEGKEALQIVAPLPQDFEQVLKNLREERDHEQR